MKAFGFPVHEAVSNEYEQLKMKKAHRFLILNIINETIVLEKTGDRESTFDQMIQSFDKVKPHYIIFDLDLLTSDGRKESKILFISYVPDVLGAKEKMPYASAKASLQNKLGSFHEKLQVHLKRSMNFQN